MLPELPTNRPPIWAGFPGLGDRAGSFKLEFSIKWLDFYMIHFSGFYFSFYTPSTFEVINS